jgi:hypothetical protein
VAIGLQIVGSRSPDAIERYYSRWIFKYVALLIGGITGIVPFSMAEFLGLLAALGVIAWFGWQLRLLLVKRIGPSDLVLRIALRFVQAGSIAVLLFLLIWGLNYQRLSLTDNLHLSRDSPSGVELDAICRELISGVNLHYNPAGPRGPERAEIDNALEASYQTAGFPGGSDFGRLSRAKPVFFSRVMTWLSVAGFYSPFTAETDFNREQPAWDLPFSMAHEKAHQRGYAREDEASFIGFLACIDASDPFVRYSGYLHSLKVLTALRGIAPDLYGETVRLLGEGPRADLVASAAFWNQNRSETLTRVASKTNDAYLKANRIQSGIRNYDEVTQLIVGYYLARRSPAGR